MSTVIFIINYKVSSYLIFLADFFNNWKNFGSLCSALVTNKALKCDYKFNCSYTVFGSF